MAGCAFIERGGKRERDKECKVEEGSYMKNRDMLFSLSSFVSIIQLIFVYTFIHC